MNKYTHSLTHSLNTFIFGDECMTPLYYYRRNIIIGKQFEWMPSIPEFINEFVYTQTVRHRENDFCSPV